MKILQVNNVDLSGARFNGYATQVHFNKKGIQCNQLVYEKLSEDDKVVSFMDKIPAINELYKSFENELGIHSMVFPYAHKILELPVFKEADIVHYHLLHNNIMSLLDLPLLINQKPSVWTIHDPWIFTGHCIYPMSCEKYLSGCGQCAYLNRHFAMKMDNTHSMWMVKKNILAKLDVDIVVASKWMFDIVQASPLTRHFKRVHLIPFGIDLAKYAVNAVKKEVCRKKLGIQSDEFVIFFRSDKSEFKGVQYIKEMLQHLQCEGKRVVLLTVGEVGLFHEFCDRFRVLDNGWINDEDKLSDLYAASNVFLMPSTAEAFGVMAIEAMAASLPVIVFEGTALPSVVNSPHAGIALHKANIDEFVFTVKKLMSNLEFGLELGNAARKYAEREYDQQQYYDRLKGLYEEILKRK